MQKEKKIRTYTRKSKTGKTVTVKAHTAKYDAAEEARKAFAKKAGAGSELAKVKSEKVSAEKADDIGFSAEDYKAWYHWDTEDDPKNPQALKVKKALIAKMGRSAYKKYEGQMTDSYSVRGHLKGFKGLGELQSTEDRTKESLRKKEVKRASRKQEREDIEKFGHGATVAHANGDTRNRFSIKPLSKKVTDEAFTRKIEGDAYSEIFPKGGSYEFFYGKDKKGNKTLYAKHGKSIFPLESEPSRSLKKALGESTPTSKSKDSEDNMPGLKGAKKSSPKKNPKGSSMPDSGKGYQKEYVAVRPFKSSYKPTGESSIIKSVKVVSEKGGYAPYGNGTGQIIIEGKAGSSKVFKTPEAAMRAVENLMISQWSPRTAAEQRGWSDARSADTLSMKHGMRANREREYIKSKLGINRK